ncbi:hypothetical protein QTP88_022182 [Uroleucon formosanum]
MQVHTDASSLALSGILLQGETSTALHMVNAVSKKTTSAESKYHSSRLELLAIIWALNQLRPFILGIKFTVITDCQALVYLNLHKTVKPQIAPWFEVLHEYDFESKYRPGTRMPHADALSRAVDDDTDDVDSIDKQLMERLELCVALTKEERVRFMQQADEHLRKLIALLECKNDLTKQENSEIENFELLSGVLYRVYEGRSLLVVPKTMRKGIVIEAHNHGVRAYNIWHNRTDKPKLDSDVKPNTIPVQCPIMENELSDVPTIEHNDRENTVSKFDIPPVPLQAQLVLKLINYYLKIK